MADYPRTWRELWQRSTPVQRRRLVFLLASIALAVLIALAPAAAVIALLL